jgi:ketosteroid isomerase-like protein
MFGKIDLIKDVDVENSFIYQTTDQNVFFVTFEFKAETTNGYNYNNRIVAQVTLDQGKIKVLTEYADPRPREIFLKALGV